MTLPSSSIRTEPPSLLVISGAGDGQRPEHGSNGPDFVLAPDVALIVTEHGDGCIVDLNGSFYAVSPTAAAMLRDTFECGREAAIVRNAERFGVGNDRIAADLDALLGGMVEHGLVQPRPSRRPAGARRVLAGAIASTTHRLMHIAATQRSRAWIALTLARLSFVVLGWNPTVKAWLKQLGRKQNSRPISRTEDLVQTIDDAVRSAAARHMMNVDCKERALASFALARCAGLSASVVVGVDFYPLAGHSWCETGGKVVGDEELHCRRFTPAFRFS